MDIGYVRLELRRRSAIIVHCSRPGRAGESDNSKPLYPEDLRQTMGDLAVGGIRPVSCSVIWPEHLQTFGDVGIIIEPRTVSEIDSMHTGDAGYIPGLGGLGDPPSVQGINDTFAHSAGHNEWVLTGADTLGIFVAPPLAPQVARKVVLDADVPDEIFAYLGEQIAACPISLEDIAADFPGLPLQSFLNGQLVTLIPARPAP